MIKLFLTIFVFTLSVGTMSAEEIKLSSSPQQTALVELYTSEGCSSCPPAEAWMSRLKDDADLWKRFVPVSFHVDYWDRLGWRDRFSSKRWTERQSRYAALWNSESVYTPAVVVNSREERDWSRVSLSQPNEKQVGVLRVTSSDGKTFALEFRPADRTASDWDAHLALLASDITTDVRAGENSGRNLKHDFVVLDLQNGEMKADSGAASARLTISAPLENVPRRAIAAWVTQRGELPARQATGGWLPSK
jgi:hypothetical protein